MSAYTGRFAPSPTGALHAGSLVAALASWLDARAHGGKWLVRIEDVDTPRCIPGAAEEILRQLAVCGLLPDELPLVQSQRGEAYQTALDRLIEAKLAYPCACSRKDIEAVWTARGLHQSRHEELIYPGTCRHGLQGKAARAWRFAVPTSTLLKSPFLKQNRPIPGIKYAQSAIDLGVITASVVQWQDRRLGMQQQDVAREVGDFVLRRADGLWAYQLAVVVDDAAQGITHIVRGEDLADNTARQILLQQALQCATPVYLHTPVVLAADGHKLSKQNGAAPLGLHSAQEVLNSLAQAAAQLCLQTTHQTELNQALRDYIAQWRARWLSVARA